MQIKLLKKTCLFALATVVMLVPFGFFLGSQNNFQPPLTSNSGAFDVTETNLDAGDLRTNRPLVPAEFFGNAPNITATTGPILALDDQVVSLDFFGLERWRVDFDPLINIPLDPSYNRKIVNWSYNVETNTLYVLGNAGRGQQQDLFTINVETGELLDQFKINRDLPFSNAQIGNTTTQAIGLQSHSISQLDSGNILSFGSAQFTAATTNLRTRTTQVINGVDTWNLLLQNQPSFSLVDGDNDRPVPAFLIPLANNFNLAVMRTLQVNSTIFALIDDNFEAIQTTTSQVWGRSRKVITNATNPEFQIFNGQFTRLLNGNTIFFVQNSLFIFNPDTISDTNPGYVRYIFPENISSWSTDSFENVFVKFNGRPELVRSEIIKDVNIFDGSERNSSELGFSTYYNIEGNTLENVRNASDLFQIYALPGFGGSLILISGVTTDRGLPSIPTNINSGLVLAIAPNPNDQNSGDSQGLLNTDQAFIEPSDFSIPNNVLANKLPSEVVQSDLELENESFFTRNASQNPDGSLRFPAFNKTDINDRNGTFNITVNLDQIPWFTTTLPANSIPRTITRTFNTRNNISARISFRNVNADYDFRNTLPSQINQNDLTRFDPFQIDLTSQRVVNNTTGEQLFPRTAYSVTNANNNTGAITVTTNYTYIPLGVAPVAANALTFTASQNYRIFSLADTPRFRWTSVNANDTTTSIQNVASLKQFDEADILPSSINQNDPTSLQQLLNLNETAGYPISKMQVTSTANDTNGTFSITLTLPNDYPFPSTVPRQFTHIFTGFNRLSDYVFTYTIPQGLTNTSTTPSTPAVGTPTRDYRTLLPSQINRQDIFADFIRSSGFDGLDIIPTLTPNDANGTLAVRVRLSGSYPASVARANNFVLENNVWVSRITLSGFLTTQQFLNSFNLTYKNNTDTTLNSIKEFEINSVITAVNSTQGFTLNGVTYRGLNQLVNLFIDTRGTRIPPIGADNVEAFFDNQAGTLTFRISFSAEESGSGFPLSFASTFTGFVQGVVVPTNDIFIFRNQQSLAGDLTSRLPSNVATSLRTNPLLVRNLFVLRTGGQFNTLIQSADNFTLDVAANDIFGTLSITITFRNVTNPNTLTRYSISYNNFARVQ